jgi:ribosome-associated toxin RatA of RatAB toxin-antitoxin module
MRQVELTAAIPGLAVEAVLGELVRYERYPSLAPHVHSTVVHQAFPEPEGMSGWELHFRSGLLRWTERERFVRDALPDAASIEFEQVSGDFDSFSGCWTLRQDGPDCTLLFQADFDFGIPSLEGILDPIAERVIKESVAWVVTKLFSGVRLTGAEELLTASTVISGSDNGSRQPH